ncbi:MAG: TIGR02996 domain-containing protein [Minicystis sp.]
MALDPQLLTDVLTRPEDDAPRLVLADKLTENGDPRGEFIVVQILLAQGGVTPPRRRELRLRSEALLDENRAAWTANAAGAISFAMRRGFVDEIHADAEALCQRAAALFASEPVTRLTLTNAADRVLADLASAGAFARVTRLTLRGPLGDAGARVLAATLARRTTPLYSLNLGSCQNRNERRRRAFVLAHRVPYARAHRQQHRG